MHSEVPSSTCVESASVVPELFSFAAEPLSHCLQRFVCQKMCRHRGALEA